MSYIDTHNLIPKLDANGSNWVNYKDNLSMTLETSGHDIHLIKDNAPKDYGGAGTINGTDPAEHWK